jgi:SulP family sulfate permease
MIALGLANVGSGLLGGLAAGGSLSQTAVNDGAGARSEASPLVAAALSTVTVIALTPLFHDLPDAVLAALIIHAVSHLMKVTEMRRYLRLVPQEFWLGMITLLGVIVIDVLPGLLIGVFPRRRASMVRRSDPISVCSSSRRVDTWSWPLDDRTRGGRRQARPSDRPGGSHARCALARQ